MTNIELRALVQDMLNKFGRPNVIRAIVLQGVSPSHASLIARQKYTREPRPLVAVAVERAAIALRDEAVRPRAV